MASAHPKRCSPSLILQVLAKTTNQLSGTRFSTLKELNHSKGGRVVTNPMLLPSAGGTVVPGGAGVLVLVVVMVAVAVAAVVQRRHLERGDG